MELICNNCKTKLILENDATFFWCSCPSCQQAIIVIDGQQLPIMKVKIAPKEQVYNQFYKNEKGVERVCYDGKPRTLEQVVSDIKGNPNSSYYVRPYVEGLKNVS